MSQWSERTRAICLRTMQDLEDLLYLRDSVLATYPGLDRRIREETLMAAIVRARSRYVPGELDDLLNDKEDEE